MMQNSNMGASKRPGVFDAASHLESMLKELEGAIDALAQDMMPILRPIRQETSNKDMSGPVPVTLSDSGNSPMQDLILAVDRKIVAMIERVTNMRAYLDM